MSAGDGTTGSPEQQSGLQKRRSALEEAQVQNLEEDLEGLLVHYEDKELDEMDMQQGGAGAGVDVQTRRSSTRQNLGKIKNIVSGWLSRNSG